VNRGITITVLPRDLGTDENGDPVEPDPDDEGFEIAGCGVAPRTSDELHADGRAGVIVGLTLYAPAGSDLRTRDRIEIPAGAPNPGTYEIEGEPGEWRSPLTGWAPGVEAALRRVEG
jgi:hypothetical protein